MNPTVMEPSNKRVVSSLEETYKNKVYQLPSELDEEKEEALIVCEIIREYYSNKRKTQTNLT
jgi:hypothetical protein